MTESEDVLVCYDVETVTEDGAARLRRVAKACKGFGQRVQYSVFECRLTEMNLAKLRKKLQDIMNEKVDSLRIYHLRGPRERFVEVYGRDSWIDFEGPLVV
jgi:CRISPR-associated protein Cas2